MKYPTALVLFLLNLVAMTAIGYSVVIENSVLLVALVSVTLSARLVWIGLLHFAIERTTGLEKFYRYSLRSFDNVHRILTQYVVSAGVYALLAWNGYWYFSVLLFATFALRLVYDFKVMEKTFWLCEEKS